MKLSRSTMAALCMVAFALSPAAAETRSPQVIVNDQPVAFPVPPEVHDGVLLAPVSPLAAAFGASVSRDAASRSVMITSAAGLSVRVTPGDAGATVGLSRMPLPVPPALRGEILLVPAAAVLKALGAFVKVDEATGAVEATSQVTDVAWHRDNGSLVVKITATGPVVAEPRVLEAPDRLAVDLVHAVSQLSGAGIEIGDPQIVGLRDAQFQVRPYVTRIVFDLTHPLPYKVTTDPGGVTIVLRETPAEPAGPPAAAPEPSGPPPQAAPPLVSVAAQPGPAGAPPEPVPEHRAGIASTVSVEPSLPASPAVSGPEPMARPSVPEFTDGPDAFHVRSVTYDVQNGQGQLTIHASQPMTYLVRRFVYPDRLAIDLPGGVFVPRRQDLEVGSDVVRNVVVSALQLSPNLTRVVLNLRRETTYTAAFGDGGRSLVVTFGDRARDTPRVPTVVIDPGHGGEDVGAIGPTGLHEADVTLSIGRLVADALTRKGIPVTLTRTDDTAVALEDRPDIAQRSGGIVFVSIHANAALSIAVEGTETYYETPESEPLAALVQDEVVQALGEPDRGVRTADFYVIANASMPAILVETAYISNPAEEEKLRDPAVQRRIADAIARGIARFLAARSVAPLP